jgi:protein-disulfide isomerase/uncharacterized membrane protein
MEASKKNYYYVAALFSIIAISLLYYLAEQHWALKLGSAATQSACNINDTFNCDAVSASRFSSLFGVPIALWGAMSFIAWLLLASAGVFANIQSLIRHQYYLAIFQLEISILMAVISLLFMSSYCLFCIATYVCSIIIFFCAKKMNDEGLSHFKEDFLSIFKEKKSFLAFYACIPLFSFMVQEIAHGDRLKQMNEIISVVPQEWASSRSVNFVAEPNYKLGASDEEAKVIVVEFADFLCPHCKFAMPSLKAFVKAHKDVQLRFYNFPLSSECNAVINSPGPHRCRLAKTSYCAEKEFKKGEEVTAELFAGQGKYMSANVIAEISAKFNLDAEKLKSCIDSEETQKQILAQAAEGERAKIKGTPAIFINGKKLSYSPQLPFLNAIYDSIKK